MFWRDYAYLEHCWSCYGNVTIWQCGLVEKDERNDWYILRSDGSFDFRHFLSAARSLVRCSRTTSDNQGLEGAVRAGLEVRGQMLSRQEVKVEHKVSVAAFTLGVDRLSAPILSISPIIDIGHFQNRFADNYYYFFYYYANKHTIYRWHYLLVNK